MTNDKKYNPEKLKQLLPSLDELILLTEKKLSLLREMKSGVEQELERAKNK